MKKHIYSMLGLLLGAFAFTACEGDYDDWAAPQANSEPDAISVPGYTASASAAAAIVLADLTEDSVQLFSLSQATLPEGAFIENNRIVFTPQVTASDEVLNDDSEKTISTDVNGKADAADLQNMVVAAFGKRPVAHTFVGHVYSDVNVNGDNVLIDAGTITVQLVPKAPHISTAYYIVGGPGSWSSDKSLKFQHSGKDVYVDSEFSIVIDGNPDGECWFAIGDDEALDAIDAGDWTKLLGIVGNDSEVMSGTMDFRYNLGGDHSFCVKNARKIKIVLDMMEYTFRIEVVDIADAYYLVGGPISDWAASAASKEQKFSHSSLDVFEDPVFTYVIPGGSDMWFAFGDEDALDAIGEGTWNKLFGTTGASEDLKGSFDRRYNLDGDHSFHVDGSAKFYRFSINMAEKTYEITPLDFNPVIYFIGATDGWNNDEQNRQRLALTDLSGIYTGFIYCADPNGWGNEFKFQKELGSWADDSQLNVNNINAVTGDFEKGGDNFKASAGEGVYYVTLDLGNSTLNAVRITNMNLVGDFNGWNPGDDAQQMTWNAADYCFEITGAAVTSNGWKFTANNAWDINLGGDLTNLTPGGPNIATVGSTIKLYPTRRTSDNYYATVE